MYLNSKLHRDVFKLNGIAVKNSGGFEEKWQLKVLPDVMSWGSQDLIVLLSSWRPTEDRMVSPRLTCLIGLVTLLWKLSAVWPDSFLQAEASLCKCDRIKKRLWRWMRRGQRRLRVPAPLGWSTWTRKKILCHTWFSFLPVALSPVLIPGLPAVLKLL